VKRLLAPLFVFVLVLIPSPASADVRAEFALGILTVNGDRDGNAIVVECVNGNVRVNDAAPAGGSVRCTNVESILVRGGDGPDRVVLSDVGRTAFDVLLEIGLFGESGNDTLIGSQLADRLDGGGGIDELRGGGGADKLYPGGGGGQVVGGSGRDTVTVSGGGLWTVYDDRISRLDPVSEETTLQSVEAVTVNGESGNDTVGAAAFSGRLVLDGGGGSDDLRGGSGRDLLLGKSGQDKLHGGPGNDLLDGGGGADELHGGDGADQLRGGSGDDSCAGGPDADALLSC
jgi:Ca2+-binding RTX toxin-like protein